jgi:hypothetical protein
MTMIRASGKLRKRPIKPLGENWEKSSSGLMFDDKNFTSLVLLTMNNVSLGLCFI